MARLPEIKGFIETSFVDWAGSVAAVVFLPGCDLDCPYCHNHALNHDPDSLLSLSLEGVLERLRPFKGWIDGVVVSGGEPTLHPGLGDLLRVFRAEGFATKLDTNGCRPGVLEDLVDRGLLDMVAMDLKAPLEDLAYARVAGRPVDLKAIAASVEFLKTSGVRHEFRSTLWPGWHGEAELRAMGQVLRGCQAWTLQAVNPATTRRPELFQPGASYGQEDLARLQERLARPVQVGGGQRRTG